jgi:phage terminase large subunit GpA-like protein
MLLSNPERLAVETVSAALEPPPVLDILEWAQANIVFDDGPFQGPYNPTLFPFFSEVLRSLSPADPCRVVSCMSSAQVGKTALGTIFLLAMMTTSRGSFLCVHPTEDNGLRWARMKLAPLMKSTAIVRDRFPQRANGQLASILYKERKDGLARLLVSGANSPASLSQITIDAQVQDDLAKFEISHVGDPELMADSRSRAIADAKILKISTPTTAPGCRITRSFMEGSQERGYVACPQCGTMQTLEWANFVPDKPDEAHFVCPANGCIIQEHDRPQMLASFEWRAANPSAKGHHRSFWLWSAYSYLQTWPQIAREWLKAQGDPASEKTFWNDALGLAYQDRGDARPAGELEARASASNYKRGEVPAGALLLMLGIDCQIDRVEWQLVGFGQHYKKYVIDIGTIGLHISEEDCRRNLDLLLQRRWINFRGRSLGISMTAIDAGFSSSDVLAWAGRHSQSRVIALRGVPGDGAPKMALVQRERSEKTGTLLKRSKRFWNAGIYTFKASLYRDLSKDNPEEKGFVSFPRDLPMRYYEELTAERRVPHKRFGVIVHTWEKFSDRAPNECHDTFVYALCAADRYRVNAISDQGWAQLALSSRRLSPHCRIILPRLSPVNWPGSRLRRALSDRASGRAGMGDSAVKRHGNRCGL